MRAWIGLLAVRVAHYKAREPRSHGSGAGYKAVRVFHAMVPLGCTHPGSGQYGHGSARNGVL